MIIQQLDLTVRDLVAGYHDGGEGGVVGYGRDAGYSPAFIDNATRTDTLCMTDWPRVCKHGNLHC